MINKHYLSIKEFSSELNISEATCRNWIRMGKINASKSAEGKLIFNSAYTNSIKRNLKNNNLPTLRSRRNKTYVTGNSIYNAYVKNDSVNLAHVKRILRQLDNSIPSINQLSLILAEASMKMYMNSMHCETNNNIYILDFLKNSSSLVCPPYITDLIPCDFNSEAYINKNPEIFKTNFNYIEGEDTLGLLYMSLSNIGKRKNNGSYYTPYLIVNELITSLFKDTSRLPRCTVLDPCCGTGNFLINLPSEIRINDIYAFDEDTLSIKLTRINLALKYKITDNAVLYENIKRKDFLKSGEHVRNYDFILGNPPWGYKFSSKYKEYLISHFDSAKKTAISSSDIFIEKAIRTADDGTEIAFVLPESVTSVKSHYAVRKQIIKTCKINWIHYIGDVFDGVQCPSIILSLCKCKESFTTRGIHVTSDNSKFTINTNRTISESKFNFIVNDEEYNYLNKIMSCSDMLYLKNNSKFALGIVTGNNSKYLKNLPQENYEPILRGTDIKKYTINQPSSYIDYYGNEFQQSAKEEFYRTDEKLVYKFISNKLIFAYDNHKYLTLNSCNVLIPEINGIDIKYIMAILNSEYINNLYSLMFHSVKVLRYNIESLPIAPAKKKDQQYITALVNKLIENPGEKPREKIENLINEKISEIYNNLL